mgnify:FL=1
MEKGENLPLLTSCCPAWVKFITDQYKEYVPNISTCRSPQGMMSAVIKEYFRDPEHAAGKKTVMVSIMPCTAKKAEAIRPNSFTDGEQDTDIVITTTELLRMIDNFGLDFATLDPEACDMPFGFGSGGGVIFGVTGGVTEAVLRRLSRITARKPCMRLQSAVFVVKRESRNLPYRTREWISMYVLPAALQMQEPLWNV